MLIDTDHYEDSGIRAFQFPGGEPHIQFIDPPYPYEVIDIHAKLRTWEDFGYFIALLQTLNFQISSGMIEGIGTIFIPYFPGARQDRNPGFLTPLTARLYAEMITAAINTSAIRNIVIVDIHSEIAMNQIRSIINGCEVFFLQPYENPWYAFDGSGIFPTGIIVPDHGAIERATHFRDLTFPSAYLVQCDKKRDFETGKIIGFKMEPLPVEGGEYLIYDDICDGGWTFNCIADEFEKDEFSHDAGLELFVTHGIFSKGVGNISRRIRRIYTTDSFYRAPELVSFFDLDDTGEDRVKVLPLSFPEDYDYNDKEEK